MDKKSTIIELRGIAEKRRTMINAYLFNIPQKGPSGAWAENERSQAGAWERE